MHNKNLSVFMQTIGYDFKDISLLEVALTHSSYANEQKKGNCCDNERMEFLGDAVLELSSSSETLIHGITQQSNYSIVKTITENNSNVSGMLIDTNETCIVQGDVELMDTGMIRVSHFKSDVVVRNGDKVVTSNISDRYLQGILIGYIKDVKLDSNNLTQSGYIVPAVNFNNLQEVLVITQLKE